jgi:membrane-associated phospholipid phosphatase
MPHRVLIALEALAVSDLLTEGTKVAAARQRPYAHFASETGASSPGQPSGANQSFVSGHSSGAVSLVVAMARTCRLDDCSYEKTLWVIGGPLAISTMWLRMAADKHYATDVLAGAGLGAAVGWWLPALHERRAPQLAILPSVTLHEAGLTVQYHW